MTKAIIFDCFGVLAQASLEPFLSTYLSKNVDGLRMAKKLDQQACRGEITYDEMVTAFARLAHITVEQARAKLDKNPPNIELLDFINTDLKPYYKIGFLSNAAANWLDELFTVEQQLLFDDVVLSFEHDMAKPDEAIYKLAAARLNVERTECIFIDDVKAYCLGAEKTGMRAIRFNNFATFKNQLRELL